MEHERGPPLTKRKTDDCIGVPPTQTRQERLRSLAFSHIVRVVPRWRCARAFPLEAAYECSGFVKGSHEPRCCFH